MKIRLIILLSAILGISTHAYAGNPGNFKLNFEMEYNEMNTSLNKGWDIRQDVGTYDYYNNSYLYSYLNGSRFAVKPEWLFFDGKLAFETGLKYTYLNSELYMNSASNVPGYFFLRFNNSGMETEYAKVFSIDESSHLLSFPLEVKFIPLTFGKFDLYVKTGLEFGLKISSSTNIQFVNETMNPYEQQVLDYVGIKTNNYFSGWNNSVGVTYGSKDKLRYSLEMLLPSFVLSQNNSTLVDTDMYTGFRLSLQLPVK